MKKKEKLVVWQVTYDIPYEGVMFSSLFTTEKKAKNFVERQVKDGYEGEYLEIWPENVY